MYDYVVTLHVVADKTTYYTLETRKNYRMPFFFLNVSCYLNNLKVAPSLLCVTGVIICFFLTKLS